MYVFQDWIVNKGNTKARMAIVLFRCASLVSRKNKLIKIILLPYAIFYRFFIEWMLGIEIPWKTVIGKNTRIFHGQGLVINDKTIIGNDCILRDNTTIGGAYPDENFGGEAPIIGNYVDIDAGAIILGDIKISNHVGILAGSAVIKDAPRYGLIGDDPEKLIRINQLDNIEVNFK